MTFTLVHPFFAWLLPLAAAPVLFHLFFRIRKRPRPFSTLMFFHRIDPRLSARRKVKEWVVLALRTLLLAFLLLALARPVWFGAGRHGSLARVVIVDNSGSMTAQAGDGQTKLQAAIGAADALVASLKPDDAAAVILMVDDPAVPLPPGLTSDPAALRAALARVKETEATGAAANALLKAVALLDSSVATRYEIHVLTDLQEAEWNKAAELKSPRSGTLLLVHRLPTAPDKTANVSALGASLPRRKVLAGRRFAFPVALGNAGASDAHGRLNWTDDGGNKGVVDLAVPKQGENNAVVALEPQSPGLHWVNLWFEGDNFTADNRLSVAFLVADKRPVLFLGGADDFGLLPTALSPAAEGRLSGLVPAYVQANGLAVALVEKRPALVAVLWDRLGQPGVAAALRSYVETGGNLLVAPGPGGTVPPGTLPEWLGVTLAREAKDPQGLPLLAFRKESAIFSDLRNAKGEVMLRNIRAFRFQPLLLGGHGTALLGLEDGRALLAEKRLGQGTVFVSGLAFDPSWSTLPLKAGFLALAQSMALAGGEALESMLTVTAGDRPLALVRGNELIRIEAVAGSPLEWKGEPQALPVFPRSGVYRARTGTNVTHVSVRGSDKEGRAAFILSDHVPALGSLAATIKDFGGVEDMAAQARRTQVALELFLPLLLLALACLGLEGWLANPPPRRAARPDTAGQPLPAPLAAGTSP